MCVREVRGRESRLPAVSHSLKGLQGHSGTPSLGWFKRDRWQAPHPCHQFQGTLPLPAHDARKRGFIAVWLAGWGWEHTSA